MNMDGITVINSDENHAKRRVVIDAAKNAVYQTMLGKMIFEATPENIRDEILKEIDESYFINVAGSMAASLIKYDEILDKMENLKAKIQDGTAIDLDGNKIDDVSAINILKIGGYLKSILENTEDILIKESDNIINDIVERDDIVVKETIPEPIAKALGGKDFSDITDAISKVVIVTIKRDIESEEKDKQEEKEFNDDISDVFKPSEDNTIPDNTTVDENEDDKTAEEDNELDDSDENDDESDDDDISLPEETDTSDIDFDTDTDDDIKTPDVKEEEEDNKDEKLEQESFSNLRISFPNYMGIDRAPNATVRIMESIGSLYNLYIAMNNKSQSKDSLYQESISSEIADALKKIQEPLQGVFSAFTLNPSHPEVSFETLANVIEIQKSTFYRVVNSISIFIFGLSSGVYTGAILGWVAGLTLISSSVIGGIVFIGLTMYLFYKYYKSDKQEADAVYGMLNGIVKKLEDALTDLKKKGKLNDDDSKRVSDIEIAINKVRSKMNEAYSLKTKNEAIDFIKLGQDAEKDLDIKAKKFKDAVKNYYVSDKV